VRLSSGKTELLKGVIRVSDKDKEKDGTVMLTDTELEKASGGKEVGGKYGVNSIYDGNKS
jgi:hypothetical protein